MLDPISQALMTAGLGIMGTRGMSGISRGGLMGIKAYTDALREEDERKQRALLNRERELKIKGIEDEAAARLELAGLMSNPDFFVQRTTTSMPLGSDVDNSVADVQQTERPLNREEIAQKLLGVAKSPAVQDLAMKQLLSAKGLGSSDGENEMIRRAKAIQAEYAAMGKPINFEQAYAMAQSTVVVGGVRYAPDGRGGWVPLVNVSDVAVDAGTVESGKSQGRKFGESLYSVREGVDASGRPVFTREVDLLGGMPEPPPTRFRNFDPRAGAPSPSATLGQPPAAARPNFPTVTPQEQAVRDMDRRKILLDELERETRPEYRAALERELARLGPAAGAPSTGIAPPAGGAPSTGLVRPKPTPEQEAEAAGIKTLATKDAELRIDLKKKKPTAKARLQEFESTIDRTIEAAKDLLRDSGLPAITGASALSFRIPFLQGKDDQPFAMYNIEGSPGYNAAQKLKRLRERAFIETVQGLKALSDEGSTGMGNLNMPEVEAFKGFENTLVPGISNEQMVQQLLDIILRAEKAKQRARQAFNERFSGIGDD